MKEGHIWIDGVITDDYHKQINRELKNNAGADLIVLHIQSPGGSVYAGYNTYHLLKSSGKKIKTIIEGEAQSIATFIALAGDVVEIRKPSVFMIHNPFAGIEGDADKMLNGASELRNIENDMAMVYATKTRMPVDKIKELMKRETALNAQQAVEYGFADSVIDPLRMVAIGKNKINMEEKEVNTESMFDKLLSGLNGLVDSFKETPKAEAPVVAEVAPVAVAPLPPGEYPLVDGRVIVIDEAGIIVEVKGTVTQMPDPMEEPAEEPMEDKKKEEMDMIASIQAQLDEMKKKYESSEAKAEQSIQMLGVVKTELENIRKKTIGAGAPKLAATFTKEPAAPQVEQYEDLKKEIFALNGLNNFKFKK